MKNRWSHLTMVALFLVLITGVITACTSSSLVGYWQDTEQKNAYIEFTEGGQVIFDDGNNIVTGTYELIGENYVKVKFEGLGGAFYALFGDDTWKYQVSGDNMILQVGDESTTLKRVR